jgi:translation initiation factor 1
MKKDKNKNPMGGMVYSTNPDFKMNAWAEEEAKEIPPAQQNLRIWLERHKGDKVSTVVKDFVGPELSLAELAKKLKVVCGVGGNAKEGKIILQGDVRAKVTKELEKLGYRFKLAGG